MFQLEYRIKGVGVVSKKFSSMKHLSQYKRRHGSIAVSKIYYLPLKEYITFVGGTMVSLSQAQKIILELQRVL